MCGTFLNRTMQALPPYISWSAFLRTLDSFGGLVPEVVDLASVTGLSVSLASQMTQAFRFLGLITPAGQPTADLRLIVEHPEARASIFPKLFRQSYPDLFVHHAGPLSQAAVQELMAHTRLSPPTQRKAVTFLLNAAEYLKLPIERRPQGAAELAPDVVQEAAAARRNTLRIDLVSGGSIAISIDIDLLRLDRADRAFVCDLIDKARSYRRDRKSERSPDEEPHTDSQIVLRGDEEVPF